MESKPVFNELMWKVWVAWEHSSDLVSKLTENEFTKSGISYQHFVILTVMLSMHDPVTATNLAKRLERKTNTMSTILDRMEQRGLVKKLRDVPDTRLVRIIITKTGTETVQQGTKIGQKLIERFTSSFSEEELQVFFNLLDKLRKNAFVGISAAENIQEIQTEDFNSISQVLNNPEHTISD